jgi:hypothetical protein
MTRRVIVSLAALMGVLGVLVVPAASQAAPAAPAVGLSVAAPAPVAAQVGLPGFVDFRALFVGVFNSLPEFLQNFLRPLFAALLQIFTGACSPLCASP